MSNETCPVCGIPVEVVSSAEGTSFYRPIKLADDAEIAAIREQRTIIEDAKGAFWKLYRSHVDTLLARIEAVEKERDAWHVTALQGHYASELPQ